MESSNGTSLNNLNEFTFKLINGRDHFNIKRIEEMAEWLEGKLEPDILTGQKICVAVFDKTNLIGFYLAGIKKVFLPVLSTEIILEHDEAWGEEIMINNKYRRFYEYNK